MKKIINKNIVLEYKSIDFLKQDESKLIKKAFSSLKKSYSPYSNFQVGAAIQLKNNKIISASNQENAAYPSGMCAERVAVFYAKSKFPDIDISTIAVVAKSREFSINSIIAPCGACRQVLSEFENNQKQPIKLLLMLEEKVYVIPSIESIFPFSFCPEELKK